MKDILLIGCGNLGSLILDGLLLQKKKIYVLEENEKIKKSFKKKNCKFITKIDKSVLKKIKYVLFCVKPNDSKVLIENFKNYSEEKIFISFIAGLKIPKILKMLSSQKSKIVRIMPNIYIKFNKSPCAVISKNLTPSFYREVLKMLSFFGYFIELKKESDFNYFTAIYGGGPAYFLYIMKCFNELSKKKISNNESVNLLINLLEGTAELLRLYPQSFDKFIEKVTSKGGTTEEAMKILKNKNKFNKILIEAMNAASKKSEILSSKF